MIKDYIYIKICNDINTYKNKIVLKDKYNKIVYNGVTDNVGRIKIPIYNNEVYKLLVFSKDKMSIIPLMAKSQKHYCINVSNNINGKRNITILLVDANYPNLKVKRGEITLWQNI